MTRLPEITENTVIRELTIKKKKKKIEEKKNHISFFFL